ncbi:hypothetical protein [Exiguobacterium sp. s142]|uniref:hypothetical protein n=1 Tax=Exiguobacterium sp. s142 TaxID=2751222 RepID=UPI001BEC0DFA|nr:hypothetical protein [Exiguobacterium sp. s142]
MNKKSILATTLALSMTTSVIAPSISVAAASTEVSKNQLTLLNDSKSTQDFVDFIKNDPSVSSDPVLVEEVVRKLEASSNQGQYETMGKATLAAKAGATAVKAALKKFGKTRWDNTIDLMEKFYGIPLSYLHYQGITTFVDYIANSDDTFKAAILKYLTNKGMNRFMANIITNVFVDLVL